MHRKLQSLYRRSTHLSLGALLLAAAAITGQTGWGQKAPAKSAGEHTRNVDPFIGVDWGGNTGFLIPVLYNYAGRPDKTADIVT